MTFGKDFKRFFFRGLAALLPTALTIWMIVFLFTWIQDHFGQYVNNGAKYLFAKVYISLSGVTDINEISRIRYQVFEMWDQYFFWVGFAVAVICVYLFGRFLASYLGRTLWKMAEGGLTKLPGIKQIYPSVKQVTDFFFSDRQVQYSRVVIVEYPRKGIWSLGLVTNTGMRTVDESLPGELLTVFVPSSPTPVTGYTITVRRDEVIDLPISIDEALRFTISGGVIQPPSQQLASARANMGGPRARTAMEQKKE